MNGQNNQNQKKEECPLCQVSEDTLKKLQEKDSWQKPKEPTKNKKRWLQNSFVAKFQFFRRDKEGEQKDLRRSRTAVKVFWRSLTKSQPKK